MSEFTTEYETDPDHPQSAEGQIHRLGRVIMEEIPGEPSQSEGAVDAAVRLLRRARPVFEDHTVEGFANYETFAIGVVIDNDEKLLWATRDLVRKWRTKAEGQGEDIELEVAKHLNEFLEDDMPDDLPTWWGSLLRSGWDRVDWIDLAQHYLSDLNELERDGLVDPMGRVTI